MDGMIQKEGKEKAIEYIEKYSSTKNWPWPSYVHFTKDERDIIKIRSKFNALPLVGSFIPLPMQLLNDDIRSNLDGMVKDMFFYI